MMRRFAATLLLALLAACGSVTSGDGWDVVAFDRSGQPYSVLAAENQDDMDRIWERFDLDLEIPTVDFGSEVLFGLGHAVSGSCPEIEFRGLDIREEFVFGRYAIGSLLHNGCTADANPATFWIVAQRDVLPDMFTLALEESRVCGSCPEEQLRVDLSSDEEDPSQWWAEERLQVAGAGARPNGSNVIRSHFGGHEELIVLVAHDWEVRPHPIQYFVDRIPTRVEGFTSSCADDSCYQDPSLVVESGPVCGVDIEMREQEDQTVLVRFADDGSCSVEIIAGFETFEP